MSVGIVQPFVEYSVYTQILVEVTDFCNYNCSMCSRAIAGTPFMHPEFSPKFMDLNILKNLYQNLPPLSPYTPTALKLFWLGEPLLNPKFADILKLSINFCKNRDFYLDLHTNCYFLDKYIDDLLSAGNYLPRITFSLDAISQNTYSKIRAGGDLNRVINSIIQFLEKREKSGLVYPKIIFQFIVLDDNYQELESFILFWRDVLDRIISSNKVQEKEIIWIKKAEGFLDGKDDYYQKLYQKVKERFGVLRYKNLDVIFSPQDYWPPQHRKEKVIMKNLYCGAPFTSPVVDARGNLYPCCFAIGKDLLLGNLAERDFRDLWYQEKSIKKLREVLFLDRKDELPSPCRDCPTYHQELPLKFLQEKYNL